jgi:uncharacterized membrane protein
MTTAGSVRRSDILIPSPHVNTIAPNVHDLRWKRNMARKRKKTAKQSLKQRRTKTLCNRLDRMRSGKTYGGTYGFSPLE